jgi:cardiolipin synthase
VKPLFVSKANTALQIAFAAFVLGALAFTIDFGIFIDLFTILIVSLTIVTAGAYVVRWLKHMSL